MQRRPQYAQVHVRHRRMTLRIRTPNTYSQTGSHAIRMSQRREVEANRFWVIHERDDSRQPNATPSSPDYCPFKQANTLAPHGPDGV